MNNTWMWIAIVIIIGLGIWWWIGNSQTDNLPVNDEITENVDENLETTALSAVNNYTGTGVATRKFANGIFTHTASVTLSDPAEGKFYEGWLVVPNSEGFFSTGKMEKDGDEWKLTYTGDNDETLHSMVVITEETLANGLDGISEVHVLEGRF